LGPRRDPTTKAHLASCATMVDESLVMKDLLERKAVDGLLHLARAANMRSASLRCDRIATARVKSDKAKIKATHLIDKIYRLYKNTYK
jgi:hypothetical protein